MRRATTLALLVLVAVLASACATSTPTVAPMPPAGGGAGAPMVDAEAAKRGNGTTATSPQNGIPNLAAVGRDLILTANVSFRAKDPWATADQVRAIAAGVGGDLIALSQTGSGDQRTAVLTVRVPSARFDDALGQIKKLEGEVLTSNVDAKDVTDQYVDLQARLGAKKAEEQQYLALLGRANTVDEVLKVQMALGSVRLQIEQLQAQVNSIKTRVDYSTISMQVTPLVTVPGQQTGTWDPARTFAQAVAALSALFRVLGDAAIWMLVFGWVPLLLLAATFIATRGRRAAPAS